MSKMFFGGVPTALDVKKLEDKYGVPEEGLLIPHEDLETVLGLTRSQSRYSTVVGAWRKHLRKDHNTDTEFEPGVGLKILRPGERVEVSVGGFMRGARGVKRAVIRGSLIDSNRLEDPVKRAQHGKLLEVGNRTMMALSKDAKALVPPRPPAALPRVG